MTINATAVLKRLDASTTALSKDAAATIRALAEALLATETERDNLHTRWQTSVNVPALPVAATDNTLPPSPADTPRSPPITPIVAFDIMTERANCAALALAKLDNVFTVDDITSKPLSEQFRMVQGRISSAILAQPSPKIAARG